MNVSLNTWHDKGTGRDTVRNQAWLYDPVLMRFTTIDPLAEKKINLYVKRRSIFYLLTNQTEKAEHETCIY